ncbi:hypothetical protein C8R42DRAFT_644788 [Lentinula raphanica]|nr:hypothetical protein C8R42DRAFT_644788 [Lentinula raphanica]
MVPLEQRLSQTGGAENRDPTIPLARRLSPMREDTDLPGVPVSTTASSDAGSVVVRLPLNTLSSEFNPHTQSRVEEGSGRTAEPYEGPYSSTPAGVTRLTIPEESDTGTSASHDSPESLNPTGTENPTEGTTARPRQSLQTRLAEVRDGRAWEGLTEDHTEAEWADRLLHTPNAELPQGVRLETVDYTFAANSRGIRGMIEVQRLLPNVLGLNDAASLEANIYIHLVLCELAYLPGAYERILAAPGLTPHPTHRPGPLPMYAGPVGVEQIAFDLSLRGYTREHLSDMALYLMWWIEDVSHQIPNMGTAIQQHGPTFTEHYVFTDGSTRDNTESAGRFAELQLIREALIPKADRIAPTGALTGASGATNDSGPAQSNPAPSTATVAPPPEAGISIDVPEPVDWDQETHDVNGDPILDYGDGDDTGMDIAR